MSSPSTESASAPPREAPTGEALVRLLREELIKTQLIVLELNDCVLAKETDKADAIAILGQVELVLEQKINYISELDRALNAQIAALRGQLEQAQHESQARETVIQDLASRLEAANQEVNRMHAVAGDYARQLTHTREALAAETARLQQTQTGLSSTRAQLDEKTKALAATTAELSATQARLDATTARLGQTEADLARERRRLANIFGSTLWRWGRPWRALFGPKV